MKPDENLPSDSTEEIGTSTYSLDTQLDLFRKLGFSQAQVYAVLQKLGLNPNTDMILGELVRSGARPEGREGHPTMVAPQGNHTAKTPTSRPDSPALSHKASCDQGDALRPIVIDGSNVAMSHGNKEVFSCLGIHLAVNFFLFRGHTDVTVFVPSWRKEQPRPDVPITDQPILRELEKKKILVFTPSRRVAGKRVVCYDDRFIVKLAYESDGIIVSNDTYRDLQGENPEWKRFIDERLLMYSFVSDKFMTPDDPLGRHGPSLDNLLRKVPVLPRKQQCPYGKKCTYGLKCKFYHPERANQSNRFLADELREKARLYGLRQAAEVPRPASCLSLEEAMAQKLTLEHCSDSLKMGHTSVNAVLLKGGHRSNRRATSRRDKSGPQAPADLVSSLPASSQERLDSGLGSIESQSSWDPTESHGVGYRTRQSPAYCLPNNPPCSCCSNIPPSLGNSAGFQHHIQQYQSLVPASTHIHDMTHCPPHYTHVNAPMYPVSLPTYSHPNDFQQGRVHPSGQAWSDPFPAYPPSLCGSRGEQASWTPPRGSPPGPPREERLAVRKKLLAIFNGRLVTKVMDMYPQVMDPQKLVAEILTLQSQGL